MQTARGRLVTVLAMKKIGLLGFLSVALSACAANELKPAPTASQVGQLQSEGKGIVLIYTSLHAAGCRIVDAKIARPDSTNRYTSVQLYHLNAGDMRMLFNDKNLPAEVALPAGRYGIVGLECNTPGIKRSYYAKLTERNDILTGAGNVYERPLAVFDVQPGEVVDVGKLVVGNARPSTDRSLFGSKTGSFAVAVAPMPEPVVRNFQEKRPELYEKRVTRLMVTIPPSGAPASR